eukprot:350460-Chlamydomonas_euryale.AAC.1
MYPGKHDLKVDTTSKRLLRVLLGGAGALRDRTCLLSMRLGQAEAKRTVAQQDCGSEVFVRHRLVACSGGATFAPVPGSIP